MSPRKHRGACVNRPYLTRARFFFVCSATPGMDTNTQNELLTQRALFSRGPVYSCAYVGSAGSDLSEGAALALTNHCQAA